MEKEFSFKKKNAHLIYAPNGTMKTSFAKTMKYLSGQTKEKPCDQLCEEYRAEYSLTVDGEDISPDSIFVVNGDEDIDYSKSFVNFLASEGLKSKYDEIYLRLSEEKNTLILKLKLSSQCADCEKEIFEAFSQGDGDTIFSILERLSSKIQSGLPLFDFRYNDVFDTKGTVKEFIEKHHNEITEYINNYERLLSESYLYRSVGSHSFGTHQASQLLQNVSDGNFFGVNHKIVLQNDHVITSHEELQQIMNDEQSRILGNDQLKRNFEKITKAIDKNADLRGFKRVIERHPRWIGELLNYENFRQKVWLGFLSKDDIKPIFESYLKAYNENKDDLINVLKEAEKEQVKWSNIMDLYNTRFHIPVKVTIENQRDIILKQDVAKLRFTYVQDGKEHVKERKDLDKILSRGEKRAFIILQFLFEMESRKLLKHDTIVVMDDIADSFDYQNKYAIIEYIKDLSEAGNVHLLILTHNYDFYRTLASRLSLNNDYLWMVEHSSENSVTLYPGQYRKNVFASAFVNHDDDDAIFISMIPFVRNLIEYTKGDSVEEYSTLTSCLHHKKNTKDITIEEVMNILKDYTLGYGLKRKDSGKKIHSLIMEVAKSIVQEKAPNPILIQNKIALSIGIRLLAENYMHDTIISLTKNEDELVVNGNQTGKWTGLYKKYCPNDKNGIMIIERVNMMTPEIIHINSFMFEPLIDMSIFHLIALYKDCDKYLVVQK